MPTLNWIGKEKILNHDKEVPFRLMKKNQKYSLGKSENLILEGDNLEALKALMPFYYGKIKCIYIDPPYNTGNEKWVYNDKVNSPKIKEWLGKVVGPEGDDLCRHDKWLCMMYPRLRLLRELLRDDGVIFISIDDNEHCDLKMTMDEIFGIENFIACFIWKKKSGGAADVGEVATDHEYILLYGKTSDPKLFLDTEAEATTSYNLVDEYGKKYGLDRLDKQSLGYQKSLDYPIIGSDGREYIVQHRNQKNKIARWRWSKNTVTERYDELVFKWPYVYTKNYEKDDGMKPRTLLVDERFGRTRTGKTELKEIFGRIGKFEHPKPSKLIKHLLSLSTDKKDLVLDSFAGSGTTGHAVLDLNKEDGGNRKFILIEMEKNIAKNITAERVKRVARGYSYKTSNGKAVKVAGLGGGFEYVELGEPLFDKDGTINKSVSFEDMARYVYFTETRTNLEKKNIKGNYLGEFNGNHYFLLFDGIGKNILDRNFLRELKGKDGRKIIYADKCLLDEEALEKNQIIFKQIPYAVKVY
ncbi:site-specific DNA-methyltransferase [Patescibacteria group bacterium]|nr:site-specific DNA-methyltransferase [Patescibacteria group bacterium]